MDAFPRPYGRYTLLERIGVGGMSRVDLAKRAVDDTSFVRFCVIKRITSANLADDSFLRMFQDEARITAELSHECIAQVYDFGKHVDEYDGSVEYFLVMEYVPGLDLRAAQRLAAERGELLPLRFSLSVLAEVLRALQFAHTQVDSLGQPMLIVHRDVNPRNIMLSVHGQVKVIDFGIALAADRLEKTQGQSLKGKFAYMSPEQIEATAPLDGRTDIYAVGLMLHELLSGRSPFDGLTELQIMHRILTGQIPPPPIPTEYPHPAFIQSILSRAMALDRERRYPDAETMRLDLLRAGEMLGGLATQEERSLYLRQLDPVRIEGIHRRMKLYREHTNVPTPPPSSLMAFPSVQGADAENRTLSFSLEPGLLDAETEEMPAPEPPRTRSRAPLAIFGLLAFIALAATLGTVAWFGLRSAPPDRAKATTPRDERTRDTIAASLGMTPEEMKASVERAERERSAQAAIAPGDPGSRLEPSEAIAQGSNPSPGASPGTGSASSSSSNLSSNGATASTTPQAPPASSGSPAGQRGASARDEPEAPPSRLETAPSQGAPAIQPPTLPVYTSPPAQAPETATSTAPEAAEYGRISITSRPVGLEVFLDGASVGRTPLSVKATVGAHNVSIRDPNGISQSRKVEVKKNIIVPVTWSFGTGSESDDKQRR